MVTNLAVPKKKKVGEFLNCESKCHFVKKDYFTQLVSQLVSQSVTYSVSHSVN